MTSHADNDHPKAKYSVKIGHAAVSVEGITHEDAIQQARKQLCLDMPRMWDVIQSMDKSRFRVDEAE